MPRRKHRRRDSRHSHLALEPLEDRRLLAVASFQDGVFPSADYSGTRDAPIFASDADVNFGDAVTLRADAEQSSTGEPVWSLIKWDLSSIPAGATVDEVSLSVNVTNTTAAPGFYLFEVKTPWLESEVTWNGPDGAGTWEDPGLGNLIDAGDVILGTLPGTALGPLTISLTVEGLDLVQRWVNDPSTNHGFLLANADNTNSERFDSREGDVPEDRPKLSVEFDFVDTEPPTAVLAFPEDNGPADQDDDAGEVRVGLRDRIEIQLSDYSLDDATVTAETVTLTKSGQAVADVAFSFDAATDLITLTPAIAPFPAGDYFVILDDSPAKIADTAGNELPRTVFTIQFDNTLPTNPIARDDSYETDEDTPLVVSAENGLLWNDDDGNNPDFVPEIVEVPEHGSLTISEDGSFTYTPDEDYHGADRFRYQIGTQAPFVDRATVNIDVIPVNDAPVAAPDHFVAVQGETLTVTLPSPSVSDPVRWRVEDGGNGNFYAVSTAQASWAEARDLAAASTFGGVSGHLITITSAEERSFAVANLPSGKYWIGAFQDQIVPDFSEPSGGWRWITGEPFSYTSWGNNEPNDVNGEDCAVADPGSWNDLTCGANDPGFLIEYEFPARHSPYGLLANDADIDDDELTVTRVDDVDHGTLVLNDDGTFLYTPEAGFVGVDTFSYQAGDGNLGSNVATVTLSVASFGNTPPRALDDAYSVFENSSLNIDVSRGVLANDEDAAGDTVVAMEVTGPANGSLTLSDNGSFSYVPQQDFTGTDSFTYRASDGNAESDVTTVTIDVIPLGEDAVAIDDVYTVNIGRLLTVEGSGGVLSNDMHPTSDPLTASLFVEPENGTVTIAADGSFVYTPDPGFQGIDTFTYRASDPSEVNTLQLIQTLAYSGQQAPGVPDNWLFSAMSAPVTNAAGQVAFGAHLIDVNDPDNINSSVWLVDPDGTFTLIARTGDKAPGTSKTFLGAGQPIISDSGHVVFFASVSLFLSGGGIWVYDPGEGVRLVAMSRTLAPGTEAGTRFTSFISSYLDVNNAGHIALLSSVDGPAVDNNNNLGIWAEDVNGSLRLIAREGNPAPGFGGVVGFSSVPSVPSIYDNDGVVFESILSGFAPGFDHAIWRGEGADGLVIVAQDGMTAPGGAPGETLLLIWDPVSNDRGDVLFRGRFSNIDSGDFLNSVTDGLRLLQRRGDPDPDGPKNIISFGGRAINNAGDVMLGDTVIAADGTSRQYTTDDLNALLPETVSARFSTGAGFPVLNEAGRIAFINRLGDGRYVVFAENPGGELNLIVMEGQQIQVSPGVFRTTEDIIFNGSNPIYSDRRQGFSDVGQVAFLARFTDGTSGVFVSNLAVVNPVSLATVTINVKSASNNPPAAFDDAFMTDEDTALVVNAGNGVLANDVDIESDLLRTELTRSPMQGVVSLSSDGSFTYTPRPDFFGDDTFEYETTDGNLVSNVATVTITINPVNDAPIAVDDEYQIITDHQSYPIEFRGLGVNRQAGAVSSDGLTVVGRTVDGSAFRWTRPHGAGDLRGASASMKSALDVSAGGEVIVGYGNIAEKRWWNTVRWTSEDGAAHLGTLRTDPEARWDGTAFAVSDDGSSIVGYSLSDDAPSQGEAFIWTEAGGMVGLGDFPGVTRIGSRATDVTPNGLVVVGDAGTNSQAFRWTVEGGMERLGGDSPYRNRANAVSDDGGVVVGWTSTAIGTEAFRWTEETGMVRLGDLPGGDSFSIANAVSGDGSVVVGRSLPSPIMEAFIWDASRGMRPLKQVLESEYDMDLSGWILTEANAISSDGTVIVGEGINPDGKDEGWIVRLAEAPVPINSLLTDVDNGVTANDIDVDGDVKRMSLQLVAPPQHGTVIPLGSFGSFVYTPDEGFGGIDQFTYRLYDGKMFSNVATVSIDVVRLSPTALDDTYAVYEDERLDVGAGSGVLANDSDQQSESLSATLVAAPQHGTLSLDESGAFLYLPEMGFVGTDSFQYIAGDGEFSSDVTTVTITVNTPIIDIVLLAATLPTAGDVVEVLPASLEQVTAGTSYFVEIWVQDVRTAGSGVVGGSVDLRYTTTAADATGLSHGQAFSLVPSGSIDDDAGLVDDFGGGSFLANVGVAPQWARLGYVEVLATGAGKVTFSLSRGALEFSRFGEGFVDWSLVNLSDTVTLQHVGSTVPPETIRLEAVVVRVPSETDGGGEIAAVPTSASFLHEWEAFWVEVWGSTTEGSDAGIAGATFDLVYNTDVATAARIEYGPAFGASQSGAIDDAAGIVSDVGASATRGDVGDDRPVLLARVLFEPAASDQAAVDAVGHRVGPYDLGIELTNVRTAATTTETGAAPQTELWAVIYDVDDSDAVNFGDFSFFAAAFELSVGEVEPPLVWWADFDKSGLVDFGDFSFFTANLLADKNGGAVTFPDNYPEAWRPAAPAPGQAPAAAAAAGGGLEVQLVARLSLGPDDTLAALPDSLSAVSDAQTYFVEVWIRDDAAGAPGITGGRVDLQYTTGAADVLSATSSDQYNVFVSNSLDEPAGLVRGLGGGTFDAGVATGDGWARLGYVQLTATGDGPIRFTLSPGDLQLSRFGEGNIPWNEVTLGTLSLNSTPADLTGNGFVDFQDLTILLAHWNQNVSAAEGNLIDAASTPVNFQDLTVLLAAWTGPGPAASPQAAAAEAIVQRDTAASESRVVSDVHFERLGRRDQASYRRDTRSGGLSSHDSPLRRLQAAAVDRAIGEEFAPERDMISARRIRRRG